MLVPSHCLVPRVDHKLSLHLYGVLTTSIAQGEKEKSEANDQKPADYAKCNYCSLAALEFRDASCAIFSHKGRSCGCSRNRHQSIALIEIVIGRGGTRWCVSCRRGRIIVSWSCCSIRKVRVLPGHFEMSTCFTRTSKLRLEESQAVPRSRTPSRCSSSIK